MQQNKAFAVIVNPAANKGGAAGRWAQIRTELTARLGAFEPRFTRAPGHATELARGALAEGARRIVVQEELGRTVDWIAGLTAVDGAVVINDRYELLGFGAKIARRHNCAQVEQVTLTDPRASHSR